MSSVALKDWNEARRLAKDISEAHPDDFDTLRTNWNHADLPSDDVLSATYETAVISTTKFDTDGQNTPVIDVIAKWLLQQSIELTPQGDVEAFFFETWTRAQKVASDLISAYSDNEDYDALVNAWPSENPPEKRLLVPAVTNAIEDGDTNVESANILAKWLQKYHDGEIDSPTDLASDVPDGVDSEEWEEAIEVADEMLDAFGNGDATYTGVKKDASITVPHRDRMMMAVMNSTGTRSERIRYVAEYIVDWSDHEEEALQSPYRSY